MCAGYEPDGTDIDVLKAMDHVHIGWMDDGGVLRRTLAAAGVSLSQNTSVNADPENLGIGGLTVAFASAATTNRPPRRCSSACLRKAPGSPS